MNVLSRSLRRSALPSLRARPTPAARLPLAGPSRLALPLGAVRFATSSNETSSNKAVSGKPASQTPREAADNIKAEVGNAAGDLAKSIAGGNFTHDSVAASNKDTFLGITGAVAGSVPAPYLTVGLAGGLPYVFASGATIYYARAAGLAAQGVDTTVDFSTAQQVLQHALDVQVTYGAVLLSFLGALHWGMEFAQYGGMHGYRRLALGAAPVLYAWPTLALDPSAALIAQWIGFTGLWYADLKATGAGWTPKWYSQYRFYLSILVGTCIIGSLAGTSYFGPVAGHGYNTHELNQIRAQRKDMQLEAAGTVGGDIEATHAGDDADSYIVIKKKEQPAEDVKDASKANSDPANPAEGAPDKNPKADEAKSRTDKK